MSSGAATATGPRAALRYASIGVAAMGSALAAALWLSSATLAADPLVVTVGAGDGTAAVQAYLPGAVTIEAGSTVTFRIGSDEPHSVTIGAGPADVPPPAWPVSGWPEPEAVQPDASPAPIDLGNIHLGGEGFVNSGLLPRDATASVTFDTPGLYLVTCVIHPGMIAEVTVVDRGTAPVTTQAQADTAAAATVDDLMGQVDSVREARLAHVESFTASDGTTTWNVFADASTVPNLLPGGGTGYLELFEFVPSTLAIKPGDTVHWSAVGVHTVTFPGPGDDPSTLDPFGPATTGETFDGTALANSGPLNASVGSPSAYTLTFPTAGTFQYVCLLHQGFGQVGTIEVTDG